MQLVDVFSWSERTVRRYIDKFYQTGDVEPKEGGYGPQYEARVTVNS